MAGGVFPDLSFREMHAWRCDRLTYQKASSTVSATSDVNHLANAHPDLHFVLHPFLFVFAIAQLSSLITPLGTVNTF